MVEREAISDWLQRFADLIPAGGKILDLACGSGRHARFLATLGFRVTAVDRDLAGAGDLADHPGVELIEADLENGDWPLENLQFDGIVVVNYLHRPHFPHLIESLGPGGVLIFDTFATGNERFGRPSNPDYLLRPGELLKAFAQELHVAAYEQGTMRTPTRSVRQRICASRQASD